MSTGWYSLALAFCEPWIPHANATGQQTLEMCLASLGAKTRTRAHILKCNTCSIHLFIDCFPKFHTVQEVNELKGLFSQEENSIGQQQGTYNDNTTTTINSLAKNMTML